MEHELNNCLAELTRQLHAWPFNTDGGSYSELMFRLVTLENERKRYDQLAIQCGASGADSIGDTGHLYGDKGVDAFAAALGGELDELDARAA